MKCIQCGQTDPGRFGIRRDRSSVLVYKRTEFGVPIFSSSPGPFGFGTFTLLCDCGAEEPITSDGWDYE
ncbi:MAG: hypothetical protein DRJ50_12735 [Actinobacteria bacterium]|nr:MAG: hypothetical protein DRJ50_12735 [Actinomycetota bacterium]